MVSLKKQPDVWRYNDCVKERIRDDEFYPRFLQVWSGGGEYLWVVQMVDDKLFWIVDGAGPLYNEPKLFGPYETYDAAKAAAEMLSEIT